MIADSSKKEGIDSKGYSAHSSAKEAGISDSHIKMLGRWRSDAYQLYIPTPRAELAKFSKPNSDVTEYNESSMHYKTDIITTYI